MPLHPYRELDQLDELLIALLTEDGRRTNRSLATATQVTEATVAARLRRLQDDGVVSVTCVFDHRAAGYEWFASSAITVEGRSPQSVGEEIASLPGVYGVGVLFDHADLMVGVAAPDQSTLAQTLTTAIPGIQGVARMVTDVELECLSFRWRYATLPAGRVELWFPNPVVELDDVDHRMIDLLIQDGRQSNREIARQLAVSEAKIRARVRRLEDAGLMRIVAKTDPTASGQVSTVAYVGITLDGPTAKDVAAWIVDQPETGMCALTAGAHHLRWVVLAESRERLVTLVNEELRERPGVRRAETVEVTSVISHISQWVRFL